MEFMLLMIEPPEQRATRTRQQGEEAYASMQAFAEQLRDAGVLRGVQSLTAHQQAARVQVRDGKPRIVDGPFAEAKEMIGGYFIVDCAGREEALAIAQRCPAAQWCTVEVRTFGPCFLESRAG